MKKKETFLCAIPVPLMASVIGLFNGFYILVTGILLLILAIKVIYHLSKHNKIKEKITRNYFIFCILSVAYSLVVIFTTNFFHYIYYILYLILAFFILLIFIFTYKTIRRYVAVMLIVFFIATLAISAISYWQVQKRINSPVVIDKNDGLPSLTGCGGFSIF